ncbi:MAG: M48 family metallopeptidase [Candidatus Paceibacteria bacterium]
MGNLYQEQGKNIFRTWLLMALFLGVVLAFGYLLSHVLGSIWIFVGALILSIVMNVGSYWFSDRMVLSLHQARPIDTNNVQEDEIYNLVENISIASGLPMPDVYIMEDQAMNAFATGRNPEHGVVVVTRGLMNALNKTEMEGVLAHEMSHIGNRDTLIQSVVVVLVGLVVLAAEWFLHIGLFGGFGRDSEEGGGMLQIGMIIGAVVLALLAPLIAQLMQAAISRKRELLADSSGALITRYPKGLADALRKISQQGESGTSVQTASKATAHMFLMNPLNMNADKFAELFASHPPVEKRIEALTGMNIDQN